MLNISGTEFRKSILNKKNFKYARKSLQIFLREFKKDLFYLSDMLVYISLLAFVTILVGVDVPRMRILFEPYFYFLFGYSIQSLFIKSSKIKKLSQFLDS